MTVTIRCRCGHEASAVSFIVVTQVRYEKIAGQKDRRTVDETPPNLWGCPKCKARWQVTKDGITIPKSTTETSEQMRIRLRKAWGLNLAKDPVPEVAYPE